MTREQAIEECSKVAREEREMGRETDADGKPLGCATVEEAWQATRGAGSWGDVLAVLPEDEARAAYVDAWRGDGDEDE